MSILPDYLDIDNKVETGEELNPLEVFIHEQEPAGSLEIEFREMLEAALIYYKKNGRL